MLEELPILDCHQRLDQIGRHLIQLDQDAVLVVCRIKAADQHRLQARDGQAGAVSTIQPGNEVTGKAHPDASRLLGAFIELKTAGLHLHIVAGHGNAARTGDGLLAPIAEGVQLGEEVILGQLLPDEQFERTCVDLGRDGPALAGKFFLDDGIEINGETGEDHEADDRQLDDPTQPRPGGTGSASSAIARGAGLSHGGGLYAALSCTAERLSTVSSSGTSSDNAGVFSRCGL